MLQYPRHVQLKLEERPNRQDGQDLHLRPVRLQAQVQVQVLVQVQVQVQVEAQLPVLVRPIHPGAANLRLHYPIR